MSNKATWSQPDKHPSGIRRKEAAMLSLEDLCDLDSAGLVRIVQGKGNKDRMVPVGAEAVSWLKRYLRSARPALVRPWLARNPHLDDHRRVFASKRGGPLGENDLGRAFWRWRRAAGIEAPVGAQALRRSCATELMRNGYVALAAMDLKDTLRKYHPRERDLEADRESARGMPGPAGAAVEKGPKGD
jgi:site-specific recombinase XerD